MSATSFSISLRHVLSASVWNCSKSIKWFNIAKKYNDLCGVLPLEIGLPLHGVLFVAYAPAEEIIFLCTVEPWSRIEVSQHLSGSAPIIFARDLSENGFKRDEF